MSVDRLHTRLEVEWEALTYEQQERAREAYEQDWGEWADIYADLRHSPDTVAPYLRAVSESRLDSQEGREA